MITLEASKSLLEQQDGISDVEIREHAYVSGRFKNPLDPEEGHRIIVHPITEKMVLRFWVCVGKIRSTDSRVFRFLQKMNYELLLGTIGTNADDGTIAFEINYPSQDGALEDPSPEVFACLVRTTVASTYSVQRFATSVAMIEAGVGNEVIEEFLDAFDWDAEEAAPAATL